MVREKLSAYHRLGTIILAIHSSDRTVLKANILNRTLTYVTHNTS